jgi:hypothetical protein
MLQILSVFKPDIPRLTGNPKDPQKINKLTFAHNVAHFVPSVNPSRRLQRLRVDDEKEANALAL